MLRDLNPDETEDLGELIEALEETSGFYHDDRGVNIHEICYAHLFLGMSLVIKLLNKKDADDYMRVLWKCTKKHYKKSN